MFRERGREKSLGCLVVEFGKPLIKAAVSHHRLVATCMYLGMMGTPWLILSALSLPVPAPVFLTELQNQDVQDGYPMSFDCVVTGQPVPSVRWFKDGKLLEEDDHYMINEDQQGGHQLIITAVVPADMGVYRCLAENSMGVSSTKAELRVECACWTQLVSLGWLGHCLISSQRPNS